ncbi:insulin-like [Pelodytes ibericus]
MAEVKCARVLIFLALLSCVTETHGIAVQHLCGLHLVEALIFVCEGKGFYQRPWKGPVPRTFHTFLEQTSRYRAKQKVGIVEKCCNQSCTYYDLERYCNI